MATTVLPYLPGELEASRFWKAQHDRALPDGGVPAGLPKKLQSPLAWTASEVEAKRSEWVLQLSQSDLEAIGKTVADFEASGNKLSDIAPGTFALPQPLSQRLKQVSNQCYKGMGFQIVRGLNPEEYTPEQNAALFAGLGAHIAPQRGFVDRGREGVLSHIVNVAGDDANPNKAPGFTNTHLSFHTDNCEILGMYCLDTAQEGGQSLLTSSWQLYNELASTRPDVLKTLMEMWVLDTFKDYTKSPPVSVPLLEKIDDERVLLRFSRYPITGWGQRQRNPTLPAPTQAQLEAIDAVHFMASKNAVAFPLMKGDILLVNDMALMHARDAFSDGSAPMKRHLLKMYFRDPAQEWPIPPAAREAWDKVYGPNRPDGKREELWNTRHYAGLEEEGQSNG